MLTQLRPALVCLLFLTVITGVGYPLLVTGICHAAFHSQATGSLLPEGRGSALIGQPFDDPRSFWGRLSATNDSNGKPLPYNGASSSGSNLGPTNSSLADNANARLAALHGLDPQDDRPVPIDLVTASGSGLDPEISPAAADYQVRRVAKARQMSEDAVRAIVARHTQGRQLGLLGEPRVNVLSLNLDLSGRNP